MDNITHSTYFIMITLCFLDILYGYSVASIQKESTSSRLRKGLLTHVPIVVGAGLLKYWAPDFGLTEVSAGTIMFLILMYLKSLKETYIKAGGIIPDGLEELLNKKIKK